MNSYRALWKAVKAGGERNGRARISG